MICTNPHKIKIYGQNNSFRKRIYLLYTGAYYLIIRNFIEDNETMDVTIFTSYNQEAEKAAIEAAKSFTKKYYHKYVDVFACIECKQLFKGRTDAIDHARAEKHHLRWKLK